MAGSNRPWATEARRRWEAGEPLEAIARSLGVPPSTLRGVRAREGWDELARRRALTIPAGHRRCIECGEVKPISEFDRKTKDRHHPRCRPCRRKTRAYRGEYESRRIRYRIDVWRNERRLVLTEDAIRTRARWREFEERVRRALNPKKPARTIEEQRAAWREYQAWRRREQPERAAARRAVQRAVERGRLSKPDRCQVCGMVVPAELLHGHHYRGYEPRFHLDVQWLCIACHVKAEGSWGGQKHTCAA